MEEYKPPHQGKPYARVAERAYEDLIGAGYCSGREDDTNIERIRAAIAECVKQTPKPRKRKDRTP